ncbi:S41 family peptidase [Xanthomarina gelatinilytica]|uniref:S41 family peptidase n=1 Tax=Xanthomarina gelatinilytica TaxID=1137281 RepID=UPI003AA90B9C
MTKLLKTFIVLFFSFGLSFTAFAQKHTPTDTQIKDSIQSLYVLKKYTKASELTNVYLKKYPYDYEVIYLKGLLTYTSKDWSLAINHFKKSIENGYNIAEAKYNIACCYALQSNKSEAKTWLISAINDYPSFYYQWMEDSDLAILANDAEYLNQIHQYNRTAKDRVSQWQADVAFYSERMKQFHYNLFSSIAEEEWDTKVAQLHNQIKDLSDEEIIVRLMNLSAIVGDGHTTIVPPISDKFNFKMSPFLTYIFDDGIYILETQKGYEHLLGSKLIAINNMPIDEVLKKIQTIIPSDNKFGNKWLQPLVLNIPQLLYGLNIIDKKTEYAISYTKDGKQNKANIKCETSLTGDFLESWIYGFHNLEGWSKVKQSKIPSSQTNRDKPYWFEYQKENQIVVFHYNQIQTNENENETAFIKRLNDFIANNPVKALVVDLRYNEGGDNTIYRPILNGIISNKKVNQKDKLYVLIGRRTFSAGMCFATELEKSTNATFVGEPTGSSPNFVGESGGVFQLPYSGIYANASNLYWQNSYAFDNRKFIAPDIYVKQTFTDYINGIDIELKNIKQLF